MRKFLNVLLMIIIMLMVVVGVVSFNQAYALVHPRLLPVTFSPNDVNVTQLSTLTRV